MADRLGASLTTLRDRVIVGPNNERKKTVEVLIRKVPGIIFKKLIFFLNNPLNLFKPF